MVRTGLKVWCCSGCGEDLVDEVDTLWRGQEWAVLGVPVEVPDEGVEADVGDADALGGDAPWSVVCVGVCFEKYRWLDNGLFAFKGVGGVGIRRSGGGSVGGSFGG